MITRPKRLDKKAALAHWANLELVDPVTKMRCIPYKASGSKYGNDGIRIDGTRDFIDSVLSNLKSLIGNENGRTRLELNYTEIVDRETSQPTGNWVCYIRVHERGREAQILNARYGIAS